MRLKRRLSELVALALLLGAFTGCATRFSPQTIRRAIVEQRGQDPLNAFEVNLGRFTMLALNSFLVAPDGSSPFSGLEGLQLAVYEASVDQGPALDVTKIAVRGWEPVILTHDQTRSAMVLIRPDGESIGDLVVVGAGRRKVVYGRLRGRLPSNLPAELNGIINDRGAEGLRETLMGLLEGDRP